MHGFSGNGGGKNNVNMPGQPRVLVIEDEVSIGSLLHKVLSKNSFETTIVESGREALSFLRTQGFEVVLLDIGLPDVSGLELIKQISNEHPELSIVMVTGLGDVESAVEAMKLGAADYLTKPFDLDVIVSRVEQALEQKYMAVMANDYQRQLANRVADQSEQLRSMTTYAVGKLMRGMGERPALSSAETPDANTPQETSADSKEPNSWILRMFGVGAR